MPTVIKNPTIVILGAGGLEKYHIVQTITDDTCTLEITDFNTQPTDNYLVGAVASAKTQKLYVVDE